MKNLIKKSIVFALLSLVIVGCTSDKVSTPVIDELANLNKFKEIANNTHTVELYSKSAVEQGYNKIVFRIKDNATGQYIKNATANWVPLYKGLMTQSCPKSDINKTNAESTIYSGYLVFQMAENDIEKWELKINYTINQVVYTVTTPIDVPASSKRRVTTFTGSDNVTYVVAYADPSQPAIGVNDLIVGIFKMQDPLNYIVVDGFNLKIEPRMPSMGNHGSPNNIGATQPNSGALYAGKMVLTMTGYWKINLQLLDSNGVILKGEALVGHVPESSIYLELEF